jgi:putative transposase
MAVLCREFDISRKTGYKIFSRYRDCGLEGLTDRSRRPYRQANRLPFQIEARIVQLKKEYPSWGAPKIREKLRRLNLGVSTPAISTVHAVLDRHGLVSRGRWPRYRASGTGLSTPTQPNDLWGADHKGEFMLADRRYCYPLTVSDCASRYLLACDALETKGEDYAFIVFERTFKDFGLPRAIRTDNDLSSESMADARIRDPERAHHSLSRVARSLDNGSSKPPRGGQANRTRPERRGVAERSAHHGRL